MEALKTVVCTHKLQGDTGQDILCFCVAEMSQPACVCVCVCVWCVRACLGILLCGSLAPASQCYRPDI